MLVRYFYAWIPAIALSAFLIFIVAAVAALGKLAWRVVAALHALVGFVLRSRREPGGAAQREGATPAISVYREHAQDGLTARAQTAMALEHQRS
jgi:hypothetical protein